MPTTQLSTAISYARTLSRQDSNGLTDAIGISHASFGQLEMFQAILERRQDLFVQESVRDITATDIVGGASPGKFLWPTDLWLLKEIIVNLQDPTNQDLWSPCDQVDVANLPEGIDFEWLRKNQAIQNPVHDNRGDWFELFPTPITAMTQAMKIHYFVAPTDFVATSDYIAYPFNLNYRVLSHYIAAKYLEPLNADLSTTLRTKGEAMLQKLIDDIGHGEQFPLKAKGIPLTGAEF